MSGSNSVVECQLPKLDVVGSNPISRSIFMGLSTPSVYANACTAYVGPRPSNEPSLEDYGLDLASNVNLPCFGGDLDRLSIFSTI